MELILIADHWNRPLGYITLCIVIDVPIQINTIRTELSIIYLKGLLVEIQIIMFFS